MVASKRVGREVVDLERVIVVNNTLKKANFYILKIRIIIRLFLQKIF